MGDELIPVGKQGKAKVLRETGVGRVAEEVALSRGDESTLELILIELQAINEKLAILIDD